MFPTNYLLFYILLMLFVIKPFQTRWAIVSARKIVAEGRAGNEWQFRNAYRMLATARHDLEAAKLWQQLDAMRDAGRKYDNT
jgi:hypothetical protein